jgi:ribosomal protein S18 acetylase RimI-like enzyme
VAGARLDVRRLRSADAQAFQELRVEGLTLQPREFRFAPQDEAEITLAEIEARITRDFVVGAFSSGELIGIAGLTRHGGAKVRHKALLWGMYLRKEFRGLGGADLLMTALLDHARSCVEIVTLTVMSDNARALRFYQRWGFVAYGVEPASVKDFDGAYFDESLMSLRLA